MRKILLFSAALAFAFGTFLASCAAQAKSLSHTTQVGPYTVTLKLLPAESFSGGHSSMEWDGGAKPHMLNQAPHPNHHMVVFVKKQGKAVEKASVSISYHRMGSQSDQWTTLPVARMYVRGEGRGTTHYGNNVLLPPGNYVVRVTINDSTPGLFHIRVSKD